MLVFWSPIIALLVSALLTARLVRYRGRWAILDHPNARSLHAIPRPRSGGVAIVLGFAAGGGALAATLPGGPLWLAVCVLAVAAISLVDDVRGAPVAARLAVHVAAAAAIVIGGGVALHRLDFPFWELVLPNWLALAGSILYLIWMLNLYNFMDGIDGLAGGMAVLGFGAFAVLGWLAGAPVFAWFSLCVAAATAGFLLFNFPPARIFMGDVGSGTLGFLAGLFTLWGARADVFPFWVGVLVFSPFVVDATWTLLRRTATGEKPWQAHRVHAYQRLVRAGWGHRRTVLREYILMTSCAGSAILVCAYDANPVGAAILLGWILIYTMLGIAVTRSVAACAGNAA
ncbi:MAG TPA: glycosyltransferase family 4 protein [Gammaproteobacteria bacterium]|nr:glycosyltransferase family 4 protein [Gammaproteobacteria bacterium]